jgi:hypothetical protein
MPMAPDPAVGRGSVRREHTFCATQGIGHAAVALYFTVAQELPYVPSTSASPSGGLLRRRRGARRVHADVTVRDASAQQQRRGEDRQLADDHDYGDAPEFDDARQFHGAQPQRARVEHGWCADHWNRYQRGEGEDALTGWSARARGSDSFGIHVEYRRSLTPLDHHRAVTVQWRAVFHRDGTNSASSSGTSTRISS